MIRETDTDWLYVTGPGHGGPALVAAAWLEGTYSEVYPHVGDDAEGVRTLFRQFSSPGGIPSHVSVQTPGSIHEGGELGYALVHAAGAAFDHPDLTVACVVGDGEAETGPLSGSWRLPTFLNPRRDGAVLPILHLNGYKIAGPTVLGRSSDEEVEGYLRSQGWDPVDGVRRRPRQVFPALYAALRDAQDQIRALQAAARSGRRTIRAGPRRRGRPSCCARPRAGPAPTSWTASRCRAPSWPTRCRCPASRTTRNTCGCWRSGCGRTPPSELFDDDGPAGAGAAGPRAGWGPADVGHAVRQRRAAARGRSRLLDLTQFEVPVDAPGRSLVENTKTVGRAHARRCTPRRRGPTAAARFRLFSPDETASNRLQSVFEVTDRCFMGPLLPTDDHLGPDGRVMEVLSEHLCQGWLEGYMLTGRHGVFATYEAFAMVSASMAIQHVKWLQHAQDLPWRASVSSLNVLLTSTCWRNDHNGFSHQGPGLIDSHHPAVARGRAGVAAAGRQHDAVDHGPLPAQHRPRQPHRRRQAAAPAVPHPRGGPPRTAPRARASGRGPAPAPDDETPDIVLACAGDVPTQEALAAAELLREHVPDLKVRFVNVVDLMALLPENDHPHGYADSQFDDLFTADRHVVFAFHGYPRAVHQLIHGRSNPGRFHVRGFSEQGTTTTPFDMVVLNRMSRFHLAQEVLRRASRRPAGWDALTGSARSGWPSTRPTSASTSQDLPDIADWTWRGDNA